MFSDIITQTGRPGQGGRKEKSGKEKGSRAASFRRQMKSSNVFPSSATAQRYTGVPKAMGGRALAGPSQTTASAPSSVRRWILIGEERFPARAANSPRANRGGWALLRAASRMGVPEGVRGGRRHRERGVHGYSPFFAASVGTFSPSEVTILARELSAIPGNGFSRVSKLSPHSRQVQEYVVLLMSGCGTMCPSRTMVGMESAVDFAPSTL